MEVHTLSSDVITAINSTKKFNCFFRDTAIIFLCLIVLRYTPRLTQIVCGFSAAFRYNRINKVFRCCLNIVASSSFLFPPLV